MWLRTFALSRSTAPGRGPRRWRRRGATLLEAGLTLPILLLIVFATLDIGLAVFRSHVLSFATRVAVREAIIHGEYADRVGVWGPASLDENLGTSTHALATRLRPYLFGTDPQGVRLRVDWLDGHNRVEGRVRVELSTVYTPMLTTFFNATAVPLQASATMPIAH